jgi:hypothetical protein
MIVCNDCGIHFLIHLAWALDFEHLTVQMILYSGLISRGVIFAIFRILTKSQILNIAGLNP